jgi:hypothetical protein
MTGPENEFDEDGKLRSAVRRAYAGQTAPPELRRRVEALMVAGAVGMAAGAAGSAAAAGARSAGLRWPAWAGSAPWKTLIAAAACLGAIGVALFQIWVTFGPNPGVSTGPPPIPFPVSVAADLVKSHDHCATASDHPLVTGADPSAVLKKLAPQKPMTDTAAIVAPKGWTFVGGKTCSVGGAEAAHLLFTRGKDTISVFEFDAPKGCDRGSSAVYRELIDGHAVEGFVHGGSIYGVVGSGPGGVTLSELDKLTQQVGGCVGASSCEGLSSGAHASPSTTTPAPVRPPP